MKKNNNLVVVLLVFLILIQCYTIYRLNMVEMNLNIDQIKEVEKSEELEKDHQVKDLNQSEREYDTIDDYLRIVFPTDGNYYVDSTGIVKFYSDPACTQEIHSPRFISKEYDYIPYLELDNGYNISICAFLMEDGNVCYCPDSMKPKLVVEK